MGIDTRFENAERRPRFDPYTGEPLAVDQPAPEPAHGSNFWAEQAQAPQTVAPTLQNPAALNPFAPTGWGSKARPQEDIRLPSGQLCRVQRLEREDLFRSNLMSYLDTFSPVLMEDTISSEERGKRIRKKLSDDPNAIQSMFAAIDQVVMMATVRPRVTDDQNLVDYGGPDDWVKPTFIATAYIHDITMDDRFAIFGAAFGRSMDDLKSLLGEAASVSGVADQPGVSQAPE